jgi:hypothetical protein
VKTCIPVALLLFSTQAGAAYVVSSSFTSGGSYDLTVHDHWVHFTANASHGTVTGLNGSGIPSGGVVAGTAFGNFSETYNNLWPYFLGEVSDESHDPYAVSLKYGPAANETDSSYWFGDWYGTTGVGFDVTLPYSDGRMDLFVGGYGNGASLFASGGAMSSSTSLYQDSFNFWGGLFQVDWAGQTVGDTLHISVTNGGTGNAGVIGAALTPATTVPLPPAIGLFALGVAGLGMLRRKAASAQ